MKINLGHQSPISRMCRTLDQASRVLGALSREQNLGLGPGLGLSLGSAGWPLMRGSSLVESHGGFAGGRQRNRRAIKMAVSLQAPRRTEEEEATGREREEENKKEEGKKKGIPGGEGGISIEHETREHGNAREKITANIQNATTQLIELSPFNFTWMMALNSSALCPFGVGGGKLYAGAGCQADNQTRESGMTMIGGTGRREEEM